ncbi:GNAT family N-acetyltransferase [uncultured Deefgea sp.]|uniref:GNAT family N-acetyltransferase n=1 Tax=uncultured Deefgea sp. TaxID=1304914 RepID=UPI002597B785|nr:GNAT family N-acetyltransferase [uncultured Deefgea sp.]
MILPIFRPAIEQDILPCFHIESIAYDASEAATIEKITLRINQYPQGFLVAELGGEIIGFINSGCAHEVAMSDESFKELIGHDPLASNVVIMSVVIEPKYQGKGYSSLLMQGFINKMKGDNKSSIHLMCKEQYVDLYKKMGYSYVKRSDSNYGGVSWHEMVIML